MPKEYTVRKIKGSSNIIHDFRDSFIQGLLKCNHLIVADFFGIWIASIKNRFGISVTVRYNDSIFDKESIIKRTNETVNSMDINTFTAYNVVVYGLSVTISINSAEQLLEIMKILYNNFE